MPVIYTSNNLPNSYGGYSNGAWGSLMNNYGRRFTPGTGEGDAYVGVTFSFSDTVTFPYPGTYTVKSSCDNVGSLSVAGNNCPPSGFNTNNTYTFFATAGTKSISGTVRNGSGSNYATNPYAIAFTIESPPTPPAPTGSISISPSSIISGQGSATLSWSASGYYTSISVTGVSNPGASGSVTVSPGTTASYTINVSGDGGSDSDSVTLTVYQPVTVSISASPNPLIAGQSTTLSWAAGGSVSTSSIDQGIGAVLNVSQTSVSPTTTTTYTISSSGNGGSASDSVTVTVFQLPTLSAAVPVSIDYGTQFDLDVTTDYANTGVSVTYTYNYLDGSTDNEVVNGTANASASVSGPITQDLGPTIPWTNFGPTSITAVLSAIGGGGNVTNTEEIEVIIDQLPDNINVPDNREEIPEDQVRAPDDDTILSDPIVVSDIDIPVEIKSNRPIKIRFDDDDPNIETNWKNVRQI